MTEQIVSIAGIAASLIFGIITVRQKATDSRKWALAAFAGMFAYMCASYAAPFMGSSDAFTFVKEAVLISGALAAGAFTLSAASAGGAIPEKNIYNGYIGVCALFIVASATMRLHGLGITNISFGRADANGMYSPTFTRGTVYIAAALVFAAATLALSVYIAASMLRKKEKPSGLILFSGVLSVIFPVVMALSVFDIVNSTVTGIIMIAGSLFQFLISSVADRTDVLDFAKSSSINSISDGIIVLDKNNKFVFANRTAKRIFAEFSENDPAKAAELIASLPEKGEVTRRDHTYSIVRNAYTDYSGRCDCTAIIAQDVTEQQLHTTRLAEEAALDSITGVASRSVVVNTLGEACEQGDGTLIIVSFDGFKAINSVYGHEEANELLGTFGTILRNNTNTDDIRGRFGGEKFVLFLKGCTSESVIANLTMRLEEQAAAAVTRQLGDSVSVSVGVSVGAVFVPKYGRDFDELAGLAGSEQERIKNSGGHGYSIYGSDDPASGAVSAAADEKDDDLFTEIDLSASAAQSDPPAPSPSSGDLDDLFVEIG